MKHFLKTLFVIGVSVLVDDYDDGWGQHVERYIKKNLLMNQCIKILRHYYSCEKYVLFHKIDRETRHFLKEKNNPLTNLAQILCMIYYKYFWYIVNTIVFTYFECSSIHITSNQVIAIILVRHYNLYLLHKWNWVEFCGDLKQVCMFNYMKRCLLRFGM